MALTPQDINRMIDFLNDPNAPPVLKQGTIDELNKQKINYAVNASGDYELVAGATPAPAAPASQDLSQILNLLAQIASNSTSIDANEVKDLIRQYLDKEKVNMSQLSADVLTALGQNPQRFVVLMPEPWKPVTDDEGKGILFPQPITSIIQRDLESANNVYIWGGAGTGKTFLLKAIGENIMNLETITVNCNQYTSPTELIGGQTIEGYVEGRIVEAYTSQKLPSDKNGYMVILDELPKIDPNTAGVLNDVLSTARDGKPISNGRLEKKAKGDKLCVFVATGNVPLNQLDPNYAANFEQDRSLQDRFVGSVYKFVTDLSSEYQFMMEQKALFIWNYLVEVRFYIEEQSMTNVAFVSRRLMMSLMATTQNFCEGRTAGIEMDELKSPIQAMESFFMLFNEEQRRDMKSKTDYTEFKAQAGEVMRTAIMANTDAQIKKGKALVEKYTPILMDGLPYLKTYG